MGGWIAIRRRRLVLKRRQLMVNRRPLAGNRQLSGPAGDLLRSGCTGVPQLVLFRGGYEGRYGNPNLRYAGRSCPVRTVQGQGHCFLVAVVQIQPFYCGLLLVCCGAMLHKVVVSPTGHTSEVFLSQTRCLCHPPLSFGIRFLRAVRRAAAVLWPVHDRPHTTSLYRGHVPPLHARSQLPDTVWRWAVRVSHERAW